MSAGEYRFRVKASNNDGIWNEKGKSIRLIQLPPPWLTWWAYCLYALAIILSLAKFVHFQKQKRKKVEELNRILEVKVSERTKGLAEKNRDIRSMLSNMKQGLFTIDPTGEIHHEYSTYLEDIFETKDIAGSKAVNFLFNGAKIKPDILVQIKESMSTILGLDQINFEFNRPLLVNEYEAKIKQQRKILSLDWNPIVELEITTKLMVSVRDITELKKLESEATEKKRELEISLLYTFDAADELNRAKTESR